MGEAMANAQVRHFKKWPILGISGPAPEVLAVATTYEAELDTLKSWITKRLLWLDANIPGLCETTSTIDHAQEEDQFVLYPNPSSGKMYVESRNGGDAMESIEILDASGKVSGMEILKASENKAEFDLTSPGIYIARLKTSTGNVLIKKIMILPD
jgi:hypothetical protein